MRPVLLVLAAAALTAESPPAPLGPLGLQIEKFDAALAQYRFTEAMPVLDKLMEQRTPADGNSAKSAG